MIAIASIPVILWALAMILFGIASDELSGGLLTAFLLGWTFIGWIILLAVSINTNKEAERIRQQQMMMQMAGQQGSSGTFNPFQ